MLFLKMQILKYKLRRLNRANLPNRTRRKSIGFCLFSSMLTDANGLFGNTDEFIWIGYASEIKEKY
jgi:hypothetical protein